MIKIDKGKTSSSKILVIFTLLTVVRMTNQLKHTQIAFDYLDKVSEPVIGVMTIPTSSKLKKNLGADYEAYVPASYKKWIEQTGALAVVIPHFLPIDRIKRIMNQVNGVLLPGGAPDLIQ